MSYDTAPASSLTANVPDGMVDKMRNDMSFVGLFTIIFGALYCLSIVGALIGVPLIIAGLRIRESAESFEDFNNGDRSALTRALEKQRSYFFIQKILIIVGLVFLVLYIIAIFSFIGFGLFSGSSY